jgi:peptide/nickel transport system ATP-binding protein
LLHAAPRIDAEAQDRRLATIEGQPPDPSDWPSGCRFRARCPFAVAQCADHPALLPVGENRLSRCWVTQQGGALHTPPRPHATVAAAEPRASARPLLEVTDLTKFFALPGDGLFQKPRILRAVDGVDLTVMRGETVGLVGESGCGKSTLARLVTRLYEPSGGRVLFDGTDITHATQADIRPLRRRMQMIFQDPYASLNPRMSVNEILSGPLKLHGLTEGDARARVAELLALVNLPASAATRFPHEFSGGQRQRISIARALSVRPDMIVADEPISALDVNIQAQIINLMVDLQERLGLTYLFIAHDLAVVRHVCDRIVVLYLGKVMEVALAADLFARPLHPYTQSLVAAAPVPDPRIERTRRHVLLRGEPASPIAPPSGCRFRTRCPLAAPICAEHEPPLLRQGDGHFAACHFPDMVVQEKAVAIKSSP